MSKILKQKIWALDPAFQYGRYSEYFFELYFFEKVHHTFDMSDVGEILKVGNMIYFELPKIHQYQHIVSLDRPIMSSYNLDLNSHKSIKSNILYYKSILDRVSYISKDEFKTLYPNICDYIDEYKITYGQVSCVQYSRWCRVHKKLDEYGLSGFDFTYRYHQFISNFLKCAYHMNEAGDVVKPLYMQS